MEQVYFVHRDQHAAERHSDGVEMCVISRLNSTKIYFYCQEYMMLWDSIDSVGIEAECCDFAIPGDIRPASLEEICSQNLCGYIDTVKEYVIDNRQLQHVNYIHITRDHNN